MLLLAFPVCFLSAHSETRHHLINRTDSLVPPPYHCPACYCSISSTPRTYATTALATETTTTTEADHSPAAPQAAAHSTRPFPSYALHAGILLTRAPLLTRPLSSFEAAYFLYQRRLNERLALPFTRYFYFKKDTPADVEWKRKAKDRRTPAREIGAYDAYGRTAWADELLVGAPESAPEWQVAALLQDAEVPGAGAGAGVAVTGAADGLADKNAVALVETGIEVAARAPDADRPMSRQTAADRAGDATSLDRLLDRTLYLLVRSADGRWVLPSVRLLPRENLHQVCFRSVVLSALKSCATPAASASDADKTLRAPNVQSCRPQAPT